MEYELVHHGIKGMKWGVRRFQKKDGTLTSAGKKRRVEISDDAKEARSLRTRKASELTNAELRRLNERVRLEQEYSRLNPSKIKKGLACVTAVSAALGTIASLYDNSNKAVKLGEKIVKAMNKKA